MKQLASLAWKEWHESRTYLWIGLGIFLGLPVIAGCERTFHTTRIFEIDSSTWVIAFGGVFAAIVAVGAACRDVQGRLEDFWRSRPVGVTRWFLVKYLVGIVIVWAACMIPIAVELFFNRDKSPLRILVWFPFLWGAIFSVSFLAGCVIRRTAHAATMALAGLLLIYLLPVIIPPLNWLNSWTIAAPGWPYDNQVIIWGRQQGLFAAGMAGLAVILLALSLLAIHRDWQVRSGQKMMYGLVAAALLLLFTSAAFQLGTNLPILQRIDLPAAERVERIRVDGTSGYVVTTEPDHFGTNPDLDEYQPRYNHLRSLKITPEGIELGQPADVEETNYLNLMCYPNHLSARISCNLEFVPNDLTDSDTAYQLWLNLFDSRNGDPILSVHLWNTEHLNREPYYWAHAWKDRLYVAGSRLIIFDISYAKNPRLISNVPFHGNDRVYARRRSVSAQWRLTIPLPQIPGLPPIERCRAALQSFNGTLLIPWWQENGLTAYRLTSLNTNRAVFDRIGEWKPSLLDEAAGLQNGNGASLMDGLLYTVSRGNNIFNSGISVFDTADPHPLRQIGHFAAPGADMVCPLPDGRAIVAGDNKLWLVGPPPRR